MSQLTETRSRMSLIHRFWVGIAILGAVLYLEIMAGWAFLAYVACKNSSNGSGIVWWELRHAIAAPILFGLFLAAALKHRQRQVFATLLTTALSLMVFWSLYDCYHHHYQIGMHSLRYGWNNYHVLGKGARHIYINWPWLTDLEPWLPHK